MKIGLITYHKSTSYGACLQAYASQQALIHAGNEVEIIDYLNQHEQRIKKVFFSSDGSIKSLMKNAIKSLVFRRNYWISKAFSEFHNNYNLTADTYFSLEELNALSYDALVVGSDQVWSPKISGEIDRAFLLGFGNANKRFSLSSSFGSYELKPDEKTIFREYLSQFDFISVREKFARQQLQKLTSKDVRVLCDPTMMLSVDEWVKLAKPSTKEKYVLTYFVSASFGDFRNDVQTIKKEYQLPIWNLQSSNYKWKGVDKTLVGIDPEHFLGLIKGADLVITDSFHGTVFSLLFHKQFVVINNKANPVRINELLSNVSLTQCEYLPGNSVYRITDHDFEIVDERINKLRSDANMWIESVCNNQVRA